MIDWAKPIETSDGCQAVILDHVYNVGRWIAYRDRNGHWHVSIFNNYGRRVGGPETTVGITNAMGDEETL